MNIITEFLLLLLVCICCNIVQGTASHQRQRRNGYFRSRLQKRQAERTPLTAENPDNAREIHDPTRDYVPHRTAIGPEIRGVETTRQRLSGVDPRRRINYQSPSGIGIGERLPDEVERRIAYDPNRGRTQVFDPRRRPVSNTPLGCPPANSGQVFIDGLSCNDAIDRMGSFVCYNHEYASHECCRKCQQIKRAQDYGCEYGDWSYQCRNIQSHDCYIPRNRDICCSSCERLRVQSRTPGCEYGDMTPRCQFMRPDQCYIPENLHLCCQTCERFRNAEKPQCPFGDRNPFLCRPTNLRGGTCYTQRTQRTCCDSCTRQRTGLEGCQYGDHPVAVTTNVGILDCESLIRIYRHEQPCQHANVASGCCMSCRGYTRSANPEG